MSIANWDPDTAKQSETLSIEPALLERFIKLSRDEQLESLEQHLTTKEQSLYAKLMTMEQGTWTQAAETLDNDEVFQLIRFFTVAEMQLSGWEAEDKSPVIWLNKLLKKRGEPLSKDQILWIKQQSRNRFLPNGPVLL